MTTHRSPPTPIHTRHCIRPTDRQSLPTILSGSATLRSGASLKRPRVSRNSELDNVATRVDRTNHRRNASRWQQPVKAKQHECRGAACSAYTVSPKPANRSCVRPVTHRWRLPDRCFLTHPRQCVPWYTGVSCIACAGKVVALVGLQFCRTSATVAALP
jgi:hypothetical protein